MKRRSTSLLLLFFILSFPALFFQRWKLHFEWPGARAGDEPHYLVLLFSMVHNGNLDVSEAYDMPLSRGIYLSHLDLDHHSMFIHRRDRHFLRWDEVYTMWPDPGSPSGWKRVLKDPQHPFDPEEYREIGYHPPGYPALLALLFWPLIRFGFAHYETVILLAQLLLYAFAMIRAKENTNMGFRLTALFAMMMPAWYYNLTFYTEGVASSLMILSFVHYRERRDLSLSLLLSLLILIKESYIPVAGLFFLVRLLESRDLPRSLKLLAFTPLPLAAFAAKGVWLYGTPLQTYLPWAGNPSPLEGITGLLLSSRAGLLPFTPCFLCLLAAPLFLLVREYRHRGLSRSFREYPTLLALLVFLYQYGLAASSLHWAGGPTFGYRILTPVAPLLIFPAIRIFFRPGDLLSAIKKANPLPALSLLFALVSLINLFYGVTNLRSVYDAPPFLNPVHPEESLLYEKIRYGAPGGVGNERKK